MRSEDLNRVIDAFGPSDVQKQRMLDEMTGYFSTKVRRKGRFIKVFIIAAAVCLFSGTVAAFSNTELFKEIFGDSIYLVEDEILFPMESAADDHFKLILEGVLSDAYSSTIIVAVEALNEQSRLELEHIASNLQVDSLQHNIRSNDSSIVELDHLSNKNKKRFMVGFRSKDGPFTGDLKVSLITEKSRLTLSAPTVSTIQTIAIQPDEARYASADYVPQTVLISPLSVVVRGHEKIVKYEIPNPDVILHFSDGTTIDVFNQESGFGGSRFLEDGVTTVTAQFEKIIDLHQLQFITIDGMTYPIRDNGTNKLAD